MRTPYVTGAYVVGHRHYGRQETIDYLLHGDCHAYWVIGNRRIGKTSLLRQLERLALAEDRLVPLFWDMQGAESFARLGQYLADAVWDASERFETLGFALDALSEEDLLLLLGLLRRTVLRAGKDLLLLCDEPEVLLDIAMKEPEAMQRLHRTLTGSAGLRVVFTSTRLIYRMHDICCDWPTSSFLAGFDMSQMLGSLDPASAAALVIQSQAPEKERVQAASNLIDEICDLTNNHPYLMQTLCARLLQPQGWLRPVTDEDLHVDPGLAGFFMIDFRALTKADRTILLAIQRARLISTAELEKTIDMRPVDLHPHLHDLERSGYLRRVYGQYALGNRFLENWLSTTGDGLGEFSTAETQESTPYVSDATERRILSRQQAQEAGMLVSQLNARRTRLLELETIRARDFLDVSPQVLAEIEQNQTDVKHLRRRLDDLRSMLPDLLSSV